MLQVICRVKINLSVSDLGHCSRCVERCKEETVWKCKRTAKNSNAYVRLDVFAVYVKMRVGKHARKNRALAHAD